HRGQVLKQIAPIYQTDNITPQQARQYERFIYSLSDQALATTEIRGHLDQTIDQIKQRHKNPNDYLRRVFPAIPPVLSVASPEQVGPMLDELFTKTKGDPSLFGWLHEQMADHWPRPDEKMPQYDPDRIFADAIEIAVQHSFQDTMSGPLRT